MGLLSQAPGPAADDRREHLSPERRLGDGDHGQYLAGLPDATEFKNFKLIQPDFERTEQIAPVSREGDALTFEISEHGLASVILLEH